LLLWPREGGGTDEEVPLTVCPPPELLLAGEACSRFVPFRPAVALSARAL